MKIKRALYIMLVALFAFGAATCKKDDPLIKNPVGSTPKETGEYIIYDGASRLCKKDKNNNYIKTY